ncbi:hypothetical protein [Streptomyces sp. C10-9-1]
MMPGEPGRAGHDDVRAGTTTLFAAFDAATGTVTGTRTAGTAPRSAGSS